MKKINFYTLPSLPYDMGALTPYISAEQLEVHYLKHHKNYVDKANMILAEEEDKRKEGKRTDAKAVSKEFGFNIGGHILHSLFWRCLAPAGKGGGEPSGKIGEMIKKEFGGFPRFKNEFTDAAFSIEGSGWAALSYCNLTGRILIMQIEKHNFNVYPNFKIIMVLDMFEHAYYIDYKNQKAKYIVGFWELINWDFLNQELGNF